jgi:superfamily II DNA or RNA helicase
MLSEFQTDFAKATPVTTDYIFRYEEVYKKQFLISKTEGLNEIVTKTPNAMQIEALGNLENLRNIKNKALIISATGTGKPIYQHSMQKLLILKNYYL